ncbi:hypothetical protein PHLH3_10860 [Pseudomonas sp. St386]|nr:hypothetical protein PHLH3_10860 [Pseudomonas sp. St386]
MQDERLYGVVQSWTGNIETTTDTSADIDEPACLHDGDDFLADLASHPETLPQF